MLLPLYRALSQLATPALNRMLAQRSATGKEDPARIGERRGVASRPRPPGPLVWCHAASVGESLSILRLVERFAGKANVLVTTGTVTSARLMAERLPATAIHQYAPVDRLPWVQAFYSHWHPNLVLWVESELWPNLTSEFRRRGLPAALVNGRMSARSFARWRWAPGFARMLLDGFDLVFAQTQPDADRLAALGAQNVRHVGNLKYSALPLPDDLEGRAAFQSAVGGRPCWLMASTHAGEEDIAADVHLALRAQIPDLLTMVAPRHPERGPEIEAALRARSLSVARRASGALPDQRTDIYLADTLGELGLFYRAIDIAVVGGSLIPHGGHNPIEPAQLGCAILYGPHMHNFAEIAAELEQEEAALRVLDGRELERRLSALLTSRPARCGLAERARTVAERHAGVVDRIMDGLKPLLAQAGIPA